jgi:Arc/MetJ-type ribon-helix-helix transcriptional regulator
MPQLVTRIDDDLAASVDALVAAGVVQSRSHAVRLALAQLIDVHRRRQTGDRIADGYRQHPQGDGEVGWADSATVQMIADEPW